uniref:Ig-like domain-containing protein n=1 Tax=Falco tinnunculus TaxID=100819 RepID=A0A8C4XSN4_FALTI
CPHLPLLLPPLLLLLPLLPPPVLAPAPGPGPGLGCPSSACVVPGLRTPNACGCCVLCLRLGGDPRGGRDAVGARARRCRQSLVCASRRRPGGPDPQASRSCLCQPAGTACGPDGRWRGDPRALRPLIRHRRAARGHITSRKVSCFLPVPTIILSPQKIHNITRAQVYPSCDMKAVSTAVGTWRKVCWGSGVTLLEELPGDRANTAVQAWGGPLQDEGTGWVLIDQLMKEDEGVYQCPVANTAGEAHADGSITVLEQNRNKEAYLLARDNPA